MGRTKQQKIQTVSLLWLGGNWGDGGVGRLPECPSAWIKTQTLPFLQTLLCKQWYQPLHPVSTFTYIVLGCVSHNKTCRG